MSCTLRDFIRSVRNCRTSVDEKILISQQKSEIRTSFGKDESQHRTSNVAKLIYINLIGEDTDFGQIETLKLITSNNFADKKIGYLALTQLFHENSELLMMSTHRIRTDLQDQNPYVIAIALMAFSEIATVDMCKELFPQIVQIVQNSKYNYLKKKGLLSAARIIKKAPEFIEYIINGIGMISRTSFTLFSTEDHGMKLSIVSLIFEIIKIDKKYINDFQKFVPDLIKELQHLLASFSSVDHESQGVANPFLQVQIIHLLEIFGENDELLSEKMTEILTQVATNSNPNNNPGKTILFESVKTILKIKSSENLKQIAVNVICRFLKYKDVNTKQIALQTMVKLVKFNKFMIQKQQAMIIECLMMKDLSIKKLAIQLLYEIANEKNSQEIIKELIEQLMIEIDEGNNEIMEILNLKIARVAEKYSPTRRDHIDILIKLLQLDENHISEDTVNQLSNIIHLTPELQIYCVHKMYQLIRNEENIINKENLVRVCLQCIGNFGDILVNEKITGYGYLKITVSEQEVADLIARIIKQGICENIRKYALNCLIKIYDKYDRTKEQIKDLIDSQTASEFLEVQQRACEYIKLIQLNYNLRPQIVDKSPIQKIDALYLSKPVGNVQADDIEMFQNVIVNQKSLEYDLLGSLDCLKEEKQGNQSHDIINDIKDKQKSNTFNQQLLIKNDDEKLKTKKNVNLELI